MSLSLCFCRVLPQLLKERKELLRIKHIVSCLLMCVIIVDKVIILSKRMKVGGQRRDHGDECMERKIHCIIKHMPL